MLPDVLLIDGGAGQVAQARAVLARKAPATARVENFMMLLLLWLYINVIHVS